MIPDFDLDQIKGKEEAFALIKELLNLLEIQQRQISDLKADNQALRDEINRLKGEQGKPDIKPKRKKNKNTDYSSEKERKKKKKWKKSSKLKKVTIHDEQDCDIDPNLLPEDAEFKGYKEVVIQDIKFEAFNTKFYKAVYYSPSEKKTYTAELPSGYQGEFGPTLKALAISLYYDTNVSLEKIRALFKDINTSISKGCLSNILIKTRGDFHGEQQEVFEAGVANSTCLNIDDTGTRVNGDNWYCQILCNHLFTSYYTTEDKSRLSVLKALTQSDTLIFLLNNNTFDLLENFKLSKKIQIKLKEIPRHQPFSAQEFLNLLEQQIPKLGPLQKARILDAAAITAYQEQTKLPIPHLLMADDAPQFKQITEELALCWVHDGRHYKKLNPFLTCFQDMRDRFLTKYWEFYDCLLEFKKSPERFDTDLLKEEFDKLFSTQTGYDALDERILKTKQKKDHLLLVLQYPEIPLHNNVAELGARNRVRKRDISYGARSDEGVKAWDTFMSLAATSKKQGVSFFHYVYDRISVTLSIPPLADLIRQRANLS